MICILLAGIMTGIYDIKIELVKMNVHLEFIAKNQMRLTP